MKAILRSINNFSCKLKQSNNLKYNISPKIRSNKFKNISGNGNVIIEDALNKDLKDYRVYGNTYQNSTSGKNLNIYPYNGHTLANGITFTLNADGTLIIDGQNNNKGNSAFYFFSNSSNPRILEAGTYYFIPPSNTHVQYVIYDGINYYNFNSVNNYHRTFQTSISAKAMYIQVSKGSSAIFNGLKVYPMLSTTVVTEDDYEPYTGGQPSPNPDYPQKIVSCGDRTKNLLNVSNEYSVTTWQEIDVNLQPGDYIVNCTDASTNVESGNTSLMNFYHSDNTYDQLYLNRVNKVGTVTITAETTKVRIYSGGSYAVSNGKTTILTNLMIRKSNISDGTYEPYGYKIPVNVRSENLFDKDNANVLSAYFGISDNKDVITSASTNRMIYIPCKPNTTYIILKSLSNQFSIGYTYVQPTIGVQVYGIVEGTMNDGTKSWTGQDDINAIVHLSITTNENAKYLVLRYTNINNDKNSTWQEKLNVIQIVEGSTTPDKYIPYYNETTNIYLDEPLRGIGEYSDYIDFINGKIVRNIKKIVLDGSEDWYTSSGTSQVAFNKGVGYIHDTTKLPCNISSNCQMPNNNLYFYSTGYSLADWKTFLSITNAIVYGRLSTPTEEDIELPNINLIEGKNIITIGTEVQGVFEAEYYSKEIIDISNYKYNLRKVED